MPRWMEYLISGGLIGIIALAVAGYINIRDRVTRVEDQVKTLSTLDLRASLCAQLGEQVAALTPSSVELSLNSSTSAFPPDTRPPSRDPRVDHLETLMQTVCNSIRPAPPP